MSRPPFGGWAPEPPPVPHPATTRPLAMEMPPAEMRAEAAFRTTHWTVVLEAARPGTDRSVEAFGRLYMDYWYPLYAYLRRRGQSPPDAEDIAQNFFLRLIEKQALEGLAREGGKFRSFLLRSLDNFLANEWDRARAKKRGGGRPLLPLQFGDGELKYSLEPANHETPERIFERQWVFTLLAKVLEELRAECDAAGKGSLFRDLRLHLQGDRQGPSYAEVATRHRISEGAVKVAVHRLRRRYGEMLRAEITRTVSRPEEVEEELRHLIEVSSTT